MGGEGTFSVAAASPERFAAIIPICGGISPSLAPRLKDIPCWCFVGDADAASTVTLNRLLMKAIKKAGGRPIYHEYPGVGHDCWDQTYDNPDVYEWLLLQKRP
jgi:predicted peptidase